MPSQPKPSPQRQTELYLRLLAREPDAASDFADAFLDSLLAALHRHFRDSCEPTLIDDCVIDSLLKFPQQPEKFDAARNRSLWNYLFMDTRRDVLNAIAQRQRQNRRLPTISLEGNVAEWESARNKEVEAAVLEQDGSDFLPEGVSLPAVRAAVAALFASPKDKALVDLILAGVRKTEMYARVLEIGDLPPEEQRHRVKQEKDKWRLRLRRMGGKWDER